MSLHAMGFFRSDFWSRRIKVQCYVRKEHTRQFRISNTRIFITQITYLACRPVDPQKLGSRSYRQFLIQTIIKMLNLSCHLAKSQAHLLFLTLFFANKLEAVLREIQGKCKPSKNSRFSKGTWFFKCLFQIHLTIGTYVPLLNYQ